MTTESAPRILVVENNPSVRRQIREGLSALSEMRYAWSLAQTLERLAQAEWEVVLLDLELPDSRGIQTLQRVREMAPRLTIVVVNGRDDHALEKAALRAGAQDYLLWQGLGEGVLARAIRHAVERNGAANEVREAEQRYRKLFEEAPVMYVVTQNARETVVTECNRLFAESLGYSRDEVLGRPLSDFCADPWPNDSAERRLLARDGSIVETLFLAVSEIDGEGRSRARVAFLDATERKHAVDAFQPSGAEIRALLDAVPDLILRIRQDGTCFEMRGSERRDPLVAEPEAAGHTLFDVFPRRLAESSLLATRLALESRSAQVMDYELPEDGRMRHYEARLVPCGDQEVVAIVRDVSRREEPEDWLLRSQKVAAAGNLVEGLAHDIRNLLTAVSGYGELLLTDLTLDDPRRARMTEILKSANRAADLARQLRGCSRREASRPQVVRLDRTSGDC